MNNITALIKLFRTPLMGGAIIAVMTHHLLQQIPSLRGFASILHEIPNMIFTDGFLFLSGFGLYFSYIGCGSIKAFYLKRIKRLLIPYILISVPLLLLPTYSQYGMNIGAYLGRITTLGYWVEGNFCGMWYIAVSVVLYISYPLINVLLRDSGLRTFVFIISYYVLFLLCRDYCLDLYWKHCFLLQVPCFFLGTYSASISIEKDDSFGKFFSVLFLIYVVMNFLIMRGYHFDESVIPSLHRLAYMVVFATFFWGLSSSRYKKILCPFQWLGMYTLELYMLHILVFSNLSLLFSEIEPVVLMSVSILLSLILCKPIHIVMERITSKIVLRFL